MARTQRSIEERISEKEMQYEQVMEKAKQYQAQMKRHQTDSKKQEERKKRTHLLCQNWRNRGKGTGSSAGGGRCDASFKFPKSAGTKWKIFYQSNGKVPGYGQ